MNIRPTTIEDLDQIMPIYNYYIENSVITFDETPWTMDDAIHKLELLQEGGYPFLSCIDDGELVGYCYLSSWNSRSAYNTTAEVTIYIKPGLYRRGYGRVLLQHLVDIAASGRYHTLVSAITIPNDASMALHEEFGFKKVSMFRSVGFKAGQWCDVAHWQWLADENQ